MITADRKLQSFNTYELLSMYPVSGYKSVWMIERVVGSPQLELQDVGFAGVARVTTEVTRIADHKIMRVEKTNRAVFLQLMEGDLAIVDELRDDDYPVFGVVRKGCSYDEIRVLIPPKLRKHCEERDEATLTISEENS
jgi:hypothetical protein